MSGVMAVWSLVKLLPLAGGGVFMWIRAIPDMIRLAKEIVLVVKLVDDYYERWSLTKDFKEAINAARTTGDTSALEAIFKK